MITMTKGQIHILAAILKKNPDIEKLKIVPSCTTRKPDCIGVDLIDGDDNTVQCGQIECSGINNLKRMADL
jgi:hypothetical protein